MGPDSTSIDFCRTNQNCPMYHFNAHKSVTETAFDSIIRIGTISNGILIISKQHRYLYSQVKHNHSIQNES